MLKKEQDADIATMPMDTLGAHGARLPLSQR